jgi:hypothetical protein
MKSESVPTQSSGHNVSDISDLDLRSISGSARSDGIMEPRGKIEIEGDQPLPFLLLLYLLHLYLLLFCLFLLYLFLFHLLSPSPSPSQFLHLLLKISFFHTSLFHNSFFHTSLFSLLLYLLSPPFISFHLPPSTLGGWKFALVVANRLRKIVANRGRIGLKAHEINSGCQETEDMDIDIGSTKVPASASRNNGKNISWLKNC